MTTHRPVEVDRRDTGRVEAGHPHRADEHEPQRVLGVLKLLGQVLADHPLAVRSDVEALFVKHLQLVLALRDHDRHVGGLHELDPRCQPRTLELWQRVMLRLQVSQMLGPGFSDEVVHPHGCGLVKPDVHRLAGVAPADEVGHEVLGDRLQALRTCQQRVLRTERPSELALGVLVELGLLEEFVEFLGEILVDQLQLGNAVLVVQRDRRAVLDRVAEVVDADVVTELLARGLLLTGDQRCAGEAHHRGVR